MTRLTNSLLISSSPVKEPLMISLSDSLRFFEIEEFCALAHRSMMENALSVSYNLYLSQICGQLNVVKFDEIQ